MRYQERLPRQPPLKTVECFLPGRRPHIHSIVSVEWADLPVIDFSLFREGLDDEGMKGMTAQICNAMKTHGFFYVVGHGWPVEKVRLLSLRYQYELTFAWIDETNVRLSLCHVRSS